MNRNSILNSLPGIVRACLATAMLCLGGQAYATIDGWMAPCNTDATGRTCPVGIVRAYELTARQDFISTSDGNSHYSWGYAHGSANYPMQYPGPTLIVNQGDTVKIKLNNTLPVPVSIVFPGQQDVSADLCGYCQSGVLTREVRALTPLEVSQNVQLAGPTYTFVASQPGTYLYHSGTNPDLQREMGLVGAIIVRPAGYDVGTAGSHAGRKAYQHAGTNYDRENLFLLTEMDPAIHWQVYGQVSSGSPVAVDTTTIRPSMWFINGRNATDTLLDNYVYWLPTQPYNALPRMHPGERLLMRVVNGGRDLHPFHHHGNHATPIARDGRVLSSDPASLAKAPDITSPDFTVRSVPGQTMDLIYEWTGKGIGWDVYGHAATDPLEPNESAEDHGKPIPVIIPSQLDISSGESYSGSPFLGKTGSLPQGHPGLNTTGGYYHMWHSHNEKEITTDDIFPGGMMTMLIVEPWSVDLDAGDASGGGGGGGGGGADPTLLPTLALIDDFNRTNANNLGANWNQANSGNNVDIRVNVNEAFANNTNDGGQAIWNAPAFGAHQGAAFTFSSNNSSNTRNNAALILKANGGTTTAPANFVRVRFETNGGGRVSVATTTNGNNNNPNFTTPTGGTLTSANSNFANGDTLSASVDAAGLVRVWKNAIYIGSVQLPTTGQNAWTMGTGQIGMKFGNSSTRVDNFGGGTLP